MENALPAEPDGGESPEAPAVRELLKLLVKAQKALRLYEAHNTISERVQKEVYSRLAAQLDEHGPFTLAFREFEILLGENVVYEGRDRNDSLAFLLFRDGIRKLTFRPGIEPSELEGFLRCLNRVAVLSNEQDDLVTLFWEEDFRAIEYHAVEELNSETPGPRLQDQLSSGSLGDGQGGGAAPDAVSLKDLEQPAAYLPIDTCRMSEEEIETLRSEVAKEEKDPLALAVVELAIDLTLLETSQEEQAALADNLVSILSRMIADGDLRGVAQAAEHLRGLTEMIFQSSEPVRQLRGRVTRALAEPKQLAQFLEQVEAGRSLKPTEVTAYLCQLGEEALPALIPWMGRMTMATQRRAVTEAVLAAGQQAVSELAKHLPPEQSPDGNLLKEAIYVLAHSPGSGSLRLVEILVGDPDAQTRREAARILGRFPDPQADDLCLHLLGDPDAEVRSTALDTLVRRGNRDLARSILDRTVPSPAFREVGLAEKRRTLAAVAKLGGPDALAWFRDLLRIGDRRWFAARKEREAEEAVIHGIRMVGTDEAWKLLHEIAEKGDRFRKAASLKELATERRA